MSTNDTYKNGPEGMPRLEKLSDSTIYWALSHIARDCTPTEYDRKCAHAIAEEVLARLPAWPAAPAAASAGNIGDDPQFRELIDALLKYYYQPDDHLPALVAFIERTISAERAVAAAIGEQSARDTWRSLAERATEAVTPANGVQMPYADVFYDAGRNEYGYMESGCAYSEAQMQAYGDARAEEARREAATELEAVREELDEWIHTNRMDVLQRELIALRAAQRTPADSAAAAPGAEIITLLRDAYWRIANLSRAKVPVDDPLDGPVLRRIAAITDAQPVEEAAAQAEINAALDRADAEDAARYPAQPATSKLAEIRQIAEDAQNFGSIEGYMERQAAAQPTLPDDERDFREKFSDAYQALSVAAYHSPFWNQNVEELLKVIDAEIDKRAALRQPQEAAPTSKADAEDAARYRWLRGESLNGCITPEQYDADVDAARALAAQQAGEVKP